MNRARYLTSGIRTVNNRHQILTAISFITQRTAFCHNDAVSPISSSDHQQQFLNKNVIHLTCDSSADNGMCHVHVIGTCHISEKSAKEVEELVSYLKPQVVFLELCERRKNLLTLTLNKLKVPTMEEMMEMLKKKKHPLLVIYNWAITMAMIELGMIPGAEFRAAYVEAKKYGGKVVLGDRPVQITLQRTWRKMSLVQKLKLLRPCCHSSLSLSIEDLKRAVKEMDTRGMPIVTIQEMKKELPTLYETIVHERDQYMAYKLHKIASKQSSVVAVVGRGHLEGIKSHWKQPVDVEKLLEIPSKKAMISGANIFTLCIISGIMYLACKV